MKKVLIVTSSPFNNTKLGQMCSQIMYYLKSNNVLVAVAAWDHDTSWYVTDEEGVCWYEKDKEKIGPVYPVFNKGEGSSKQLFDVIKSLKIDIVLSIGDFIDIEHIYSIKTLEKDNLIWINILNNGSSPINENKEEIINSIDYHILFNDMSVKEFEKMNVPQEKYTRILYGSKYIDLSNKENKDYFGIACVAKNCNQSNLGCFIKSISVFMKLIKEEKSEDKIKVYLHTNLYDNGDYDIEYLIKRYGLEGTIELPEDFIGINDGISDEKFKEKLKKYDLIIDCSCQSAIGISVLDGMSLGLVPLVSNVGILKEISSKMKSSSGKFSKILPFNISGNEFIASDEKEFYICSHLDLAASIYEYYKTWENNNLIELFEISKNVSKNYDLQNFLQNTYKIIKDFKVDSNKLVVETF